MNTSEAKIARKSDGQAEFDSLLPAAQVNRRGFIVTALGAGFALSVQPTAAQSPIKTGTEGLTAGEVKVPVADGEMVAYRAMPAGKTGVPVVLVVSEIFGVHEYIADVCRRLAKEGYLAIAPELFARYGDPRKYASVADLYAGSGAVGLESLSPAWRRTLTPASPGPARTAATPAAWQSPGFAGAGAKPGSTPRTILRSRPGSRGTGASTARSTTARRNTRSI